MLFSSWEVLHSQIHFLGDRKISPEFEKLSDEQQQRHENVKLSGQSKILLEFRVNPIKMQHVLFAFVVKHLYFYILIVFI